jgi:hypothetical protein
VPALRPDQEAISVMTNWVVYHARRHEEHGAAPLTLCQQLAQQRQHRRVGKMEHHGADEKEDQRAILEEHPDLARVKRIP